MASPVVFAYDGSELAKLAIEEAGRQLAPGRDALVVCVWQPAEVGFVPVGEQHFDTQNAVEVEAAAQETAAQGVALAEQAGFQAKSVVVNAAPTWEGLVKVAEEQQASLVVLGAHRRTGVVGHFVGSVTSAVLGHSTLPVLVVRQPSD